MTVVTRPNYDAERLHRLDVAHQLHPFSNNRAIAEAGGGPIYTRAEGPYVWDIDNRRYLDAMAGLWCVNIGYGRKELADVAGRQMQELSYFSSFFNGTTPPTIELAGKISDLAGGRLGRAIFANSGSEANDTVVWLARRYWELIGKPKKKFFIARRNAYHGSTMMAASLGNWGRMHEQGGLPLPGVAHVRQPYWFGEGGDATPEEFGLVCARAIEDKILELGADSVAAVIGEPVQGAGGVIVPPASYWPEVQRICRKHDVLLVADEVICGFGRTGSMFGSETFKLQPDIITVAKALSSAYLPISSVIINDKVYRALRDNSGKIGTFGHGYTYSGHPVSAAVAVETLKIYEERDIISQVRRVVPALQNGLRKFADHPLVGEVRGTGLIGGIELVKNKATKEAFDPKAGIGPYAVGRAQTHGLLTRALGDTVAFCPPLIITEAQIGDLLARFGKALDDTHAKVREERLVAA